MSTKTLIGIGLIFLFFLGGIFLGYNVKKYKSCPEIKDSLLVEGDTVWLPSDTTFMIREIEVSPQISVDSAVTLKIDTMFVSDKDTISVYGLVDYWLDHNVFDWYMEIKHKDFDFHKIDTLKIYLVDSVKVEVGNPWLWVAVIAEFLLLILALI